MSDAAGRRSLDMVGIAHLDAAWLWPWTEGYAEVRATVRSALDRLDEDPDFVFTCDSIAYYAWIEENDPELFERMRARIAEGRWEPAGGWWVEPDCNIPTGESLVRQGLYGQRYLIERFGRPARVGMNVDPFGHPASLPQILRGLGLESYVFHRPGAHELRLPAPLFRWRGTDGSEVLGYRIPHEYCTGSADIGNHVDKTLAQLPPDADGLMCFYGVGNHGGGPTRANLASIRRIDATAGQPHLRFSSPERFFGRVQADARDALPVVEGDLHHHAVGCYSAHAGVKAWNRRAEGLLLTAETWSTIASRMGASTDDDRAALAEAWKLLALNQFHDVLAGSSIESVYLDTRDQLGEVSSVASRIANRAIQRIARLVDIPQVPGTHQLLVFNPLPWASHGTVEFEFGAHWGFEGVEATMTDADGRLVEIQRTRSEAMFPDRRRLVFEAAVPAHGYALYRLLPHGLQERSSLLHQPATPRLRKTMRSHDLLLENRHLRAEVDPDTGWLRTLSVGGGPSLLLEDPGPHAVVLEDPGDTWGHRIERYDREVGAFMVRSVRLVESGPVRAIIRVESGYEGSTLVEELILSRDARVLEIRSTLDWHQHRQLLKLRVASSLRDVVATWELPYGHAIRATDGREAPGQGWIDLSGTGPSGEAVGLSILNDGKHAFDVVGGRLGMTVARGAVQAWHDPLPIEPDVPHTYLDQGVQRFRYALLPHGGDWRTAGTVVQAARLGRPPSTLLEGAHPGRLPSAGGFIDVMPATVAVTVVKRGEDDGADTVVRIHETAGRSTDARIDLPALHRTLHVPLRPQELVTLRIPPDPGRPWEPIDLVERTLTT